MRRRSFFKTTAAHTQGNEHSELLQKYYRTVLENCTAKKNHSSTFDSSLFTFTVCFDSHLQVLCPEEDYALDNTHNSSQLSTLLWREQEKSNIFKSSQHTNSLVVPQMRSKKHERISTKSVVESLMKRRTLTSCVSVTDTLSERTTSCGK